MGSHEVVQWYLKETGSLEFFLRDLEKGGQRYGQAFFNALSEEDRARLVGSVWDPFYSNEPFDSAMAVMEVLTK